MAKKWARNYLKDLDPQKYYFEKADVDEFLARDTELDDKIKEGERRLRPGRSSTGSSSAPTSGWQAVKEILKPKPDFTVDETIVDDPDKLDYPADAAEASERLAQADQARAAPAQGRQGRRGRGVKQAHGPVQATATGSSTSSTASDLLEIYLTSLTKTFDPHSSYIAPRRVEDIDQPAASTCPSTASAPRSQSEDGYAVVKELVPGGPADKDGRLQPEDKILGIEKDDGERDRLRREEAQRRRPQDPRRGGTKVRLIVQPADTKEKKIYELTRQKIELDEQHAKGQIIEAKAERRQGPQDRRHQPARLLRRHRAPCRKGDARRRQRHRGLPASSSKASRRRASTPWWSTSARTAAACSTRRSPSPACSSTRARSSRSASASGVRHLDDDEEGTAWDGPLAVLIDHQSASASEIFAGVIKDYGRGLIIGDSNTFGKGTVQSIVPINEQLRLRGATCPTSAP